MLGSFLALEKSCKSSHGKASEAIEKIDSNELDSELNRNFAPLWWWRPVERRSGEQNLRSRLRAGAPAQEPCEVLKLAQVEGVLMMNYVGLDRKFAHCRIGAGRPGPRIGAHGWANGRSLLGGGGGAWSDQARLRKSSYRRQFDLKRTGAGETKKKRRGVCFVCVCWRTWQCEAGHPDYVISLAKRFGLVRADCPRRKQIGGGGGARLLGFR